MSKLKSYLYNIILLITIFAIPLIFNLVLTGHENYWLLLALQFFGLALLYFVLILNGIPRKKAVIGVVSVLAFQFLNSIASNDRIFYIVESRTVINMPRIICQFYNAINSVRIIDSSDILVLSLQVSIVTTIFMKYDFKSYIYIAASCVVFTSPVIIGLQKAFESLRPSESLTDYLRDIYAFFLPELLLMIVCAFLFRAIIICFKKKLILGKL